MPYTGYTGRLFEEEVLGRCRGHWDGYMDWKQSLMYASTHQPKGWDPTDPSRDDANDLHAFVAMELGIEDWSQLGLFSAVGTPFDQFHGVDGFFVFQGTVVTIDVTLNPHKDDWKSDLIVHPNDLESETALQILARKIVSLLQSKKPVLT